MQGKINFEDVEASQVYIGFRYGKIRVEVEMSVDSVMRILENRRAIEKWGDKANTIPVVIPWNEMYADGGKLDYEALETAVSLYHALNEIKDKVLEKIAEELDKLR